MKIVMDRCEVDQNKQSCISSVQNRNEKTAIMIIEDDSIIRMLLCSMVKLHHPDIQVIECINGADAYSKMNEAVNLIFTDNNMPILSGLEFIRKIKSESIYQNIPVVMVSVEAREEYIFLGNKLGLAGWIVKPFILSQIDEYLNRYV